MNWSKIYRRLKNNSREFKHLILVYQEYDQKTILTQCWIQWGGVSKRGQKCGKNNDFNSNSRTHTWIHHCFATVTCFTTLHFHYNEKRFFEQGYLLLMICRENRSPTRWRQPISNGMTSLLLNVWITQNLLSNQRNKIDSTLLTWSLKFRFANQKSSWKWALKYNLKSTVEGELRKKT